MKPKNNNRIFTITEVYMWAAIALIVGAMGFLGIGYMWRLGRWISENLL